MTRALHLIGAAVDTTDFVVGEALHSLTDVSGPLRPAAGNLRTATSEDCELLLGWMIAFGADIGDHWRSRVTARLDQRLAAGQYFIWEDGRRVSALAHHVQIAGAVRIGPARSAAGSVSGTRRALTSGARIPPAAGRARLHPATPRRLRRLHRWPAWARRPPGPRVQSM